MESLHTRCPTLSKFGINGSAWKTADTMQRIFDHKDTEVYAHTATGGFPVQEIDWSQFTIDWEYMDEW